MNREEWAQPVSAEEASKRAAGRRRINEARAKAVVARRARLIYLVARDGAHPIAIKEFAAELGVSVRTVQRDLRALLAAGDVVVIEATVRRLLVQARTRPRMESVQGTQEPARVLVWDSAQEEMARFRQRLAAINAGWRPDGFPG